MVPEDLTLIPVQPGASSVGAGVFTACCEYGYRCISKKEIEIEARVRV